MSVSYAMQEPGVVCIHDDFGSFALNRENVLVAIENVKKERALYANEDAYLRSLALYLDALAFIDKQDAR